jgi:hypothetical protein
MQVASNKVATLDMVGFVCIWDCIILTSICSYQVRPPSPRSHLLGALFANNWCSASHLEPSARFSNVTQMNPNTADDLRRSVFT